MEDKATINFSGVDHLEAVTTEKTIVRGQRCPWICPDCGVSAVIPSDGCVRCLNCGWSVCEV